ncbi:AraC family transcriptional regulator [Roseivirga seohaensis]|uniref:AraC family transcriptional regulator n=1 Tax=Roseivirga seohaensis TaxID=1914963 RepID=A0A150XLC4_9BACT|nr:helix-turn-helix domain-containing protein [Roseivirga seohaensis]KYG79432.1 AraC family transcriptional regulator [Roseivirga seohaensis]
MRYKIIPPDEGLKDIISHFWVGTWNSEHQSPNSRYYVIANSLTEFTFAFENDTPRSKLLFSVVQGHTNQPNQFQVDGFYHLIGVSIYSYSIPTLFNIPALELNNQFISLNTFLGSEGEILTEKVALAATTQERINVITFFFKSLIEKQRYKDRLIVNAIQEIKKRNGKTKISNLASDFCLSQKQFERRFKEFSGFNPKMYSRIIRFESIIKKPNSQSILEEAYTHGFYDQAHFIHEFKCFTGFNPSDFYKLSS